MAKSFHRTGLPCALLRTISIMQPKEYAILNHNCNDTNRNSVNLRAQQKVLLLLARETMVSHSFYQSNIACPYYRTDAGEEVVVSYGAHSNDVLLVDCKFDPVVICFIILLNSAKMGFCLRTINTTASNLMLISYLNCLRIRNKHSRTLGIIRMYDLWAIKAKLMIQQLWPL
jgi:hypothetical protein